MSVNQSCPRALGPIRQGARWVLPLMLGILAVAALTLSGCEEDDDSDASSPEVYFVYVANYGSGDISGFLMDKETGRLTEMDDSPFNGLGNNDRLVVHPGLGALIVEEPADTIAIRTIDPETGALAPVAGSGQSVGMGGTSYTALTPDGTRLYATDLATALMRGFDYDTDRNTLTEMDVSPFGTPLGQQEIAIETGGNFLYAPDAGTGDIRFYAIDSGSGDLTEAGASPFSPGVDARWLVPDPLGDYLFMGDQSPYGVHTLTLDAASGALSLADSAPASDPPLSLSVHPEGTHLYFATNGGVEVYSVNRGNGTLSGVQGSPFFSTVTANHVAVTPNGRFLVVPDPSFNYVMVRELGTSGAPGSSTVDAADTGNSPAFVVVIDPENASP